MVVFNIHDNIFLEYQTFPKKKEALILLKL